MINVRKTYTESRAKVMNIFKIDIASKYRITGQQEKFSDIFGEIKPEVVASELSAVISKGNKEITYGEFIIDYKTKYSVLFADNTGIEEIMADTGMTDTEKMTAIRQYIIGVLVSYIGKEIIPHISETLVDTDSMKLNEKQIVVYRILQMLMYGKSVEYIKNYEFKPGTGTLIEIVNSIIDKNTGVIGAWANTDMTIKTLADDSEAISKLGEIHAIISNNISIDIGDKITIATLDGIKATLSAA